MKQPPKEFVEFLAAVTDLAQPVANKLGCMTIVVEIDIPDATAPEWEDHFKVKAHIHKSTQQ